MNFNIARIIDLFIGNILIKFFFLFPPFPKKITPRIDFKNLLVIKFWGLGSIIEATPLLRGLRQKFPDIPIDILTFSTNRQIIDSLGLFQKVHVIDIKGSGLGFFLQTLRFVLENRRKYSMIIDLEFFANFSALLTKMLASTYSLGFESFFVSRNQCYSRTVIFDHSRHVRTIFLKFLEALHINSNIDLILSIPIVPDEKKLLVKQKFASLADNGFSRIAININTSELCLNRRWPEENFRKLISFIQQDYNKLQIYLVGGKEDLPSVKSFYESLSVQNQVFITAGELDILAFSYFLSYMDCLITSDSGPLHIAEAVGIPVASFFGPETPNLYGPLFDKSIVFYKDLFCSPCLNTYNHKRDRCRDNQCLKLILPEEVYVRIKADFL